jgi:hypothetical protein
MRIDRGPRAAGGGRPGERGFAFAIALFVMTTLALVAASALLVGSANIEATRNYRSALQVHFVAESGIADALQTLNGPGVVNFGNDVVTNWTNVWGSGARTFTPLPGFTYTVTPVADASNPDNAGRLIATATGARGERNVVVAKVQRSNVPLTTPGAVYLATDQQSNATFNGNAFTVDGNDHDYNGGRGPAPPVPGIATRNDANTQETLDSLNQQQADNLQGLGFSPGPPTVPSVGTYPAAPSIAQMNQFIDDLLSRSGVVTYSSDRINGSATFGTTSAPQITHFTASDGVTIKGNGNASGAGVLIIEGDLTIQGTLNFKGLVLVRGRTNVVNDPSMTDVTGNATVYGSLWTQDLNLVVGGSAIVDYSSNALQLANQVAGGGALPAALLVTWLADCSQLPAGANGCP